MKYATFNDVGELVGRHDGAHSAVPEGAVALPDALWFATMNETDGVWRLVDGEVIKLPFAEVVPDYAQLVAVESYKREATGVTVEGLLIETTRDSQALIASIGLSAVLDPDYRCNFETAGGFVEIGAAQIITIAKAVRAHVQACFDRKFALLRAIEAGDYSDDMLLQGWPDSPPPDPAELQ
jgi:hypothetical protein